jgi:hypothetical protein
MALGKNFQRTLPEGHLRLINHQNWLILAINFN